VDLYQIHWPTPPLPVETWVDALGEAAQAGLTRAAGVSNYTTPQVIRAHAALARRGLPLATVQVRYNVLSRDPERNGLLETCARLGITLIAYSPLAQGMLTGTYSVEHPPPGLRRVLYAKVLARLGPLSGLLREIGQAHAKTPAQVALNWIICKGALPIPGARSVRQARENAGALGWRLGATEVAALDESGDRIRQG
jgi:aryl-alcohol dehydrogenase-like predicted oxidoreductase